MQCPLLYMSEGIQSTHRQPGMSTIELVYNTCVYIRQCPLLYKYIFDKEFKCMTVCNNIIGTWDVQYCTHLQTF